MKPLTISSSDLARGVVDGLICIYKRVGETPLEALGRLRATYPVLTKTPLSYAGRLDPLAEGLLLILSGSYNKNRTEYLGFNKVYQIEILLGIATDSGDSLGLVTHVAPTVCTEEEVTEVLRTYIGTQTYTYPIYSSKTVQGKPLHEWAREGKINTIELPTYTATIQDIQCNGMRVVTCREVVEEVCKRNSLVHGDFRQNEIQKTWQKISSDGEVSIVDITVSCTSGTYMRVLADEIAKKLHTRGMAYSIKRLKVGEYTISDCIDL